VSGEAASAYYWDGSAWTAGTVAAKALTGAVALTSAAAVSAIAALTF